jgi:hypothetical protein
LKYYNFLWFQWEPAGSNQFCHDIKYFGRGHTKSFM